MDNFISQDCLYKVLLISSGETVFSKNVRLITSSLKQNWIILLAMQLWSAANEFNIL